MDLQFARIHWERATGCGGMKKQSCFVFASSLVGVERTGQESLERGFCVGCDGTGVAAPSAPGIRESHAVIQPAATTYP